MPLTPLEQTLLTRDPDAIFDFADSDQCLIVDHREEEQDIFANVAALLPPGYFQFTFDEDTCAFTATCAGRTDTLQLQLDPGDRYRALNFINQLLQPEYQIKNLKCRYGDDTHSLLIRPRGWWEEFRAAYPEQFGDLFLDLDQNSGFY